MPPKSLKMEKTVIELSSDSDSEDASILIIDGSPVVVRPNNHRRLLDAELAKRNQDATALAEQYGEDDSGWGVKLVRADVGNQLSCLKSLFITVVPQLISGLGKPFSVVVFAGSDADEHHPLIEKPFTTFPAIRVRVDFPTDSRIAKFSLSCPWLVKYFTKPLAARLQEVYEKNQRSVRAAIQWLEMSGLASLDIVRSHRICYVTPDIPFKKPYHISFEDPESVVVFFDAMILRCSQLWESKLSPGGAFECGICFERKPSLTAAVFNGCSHYFCRHCVARDMSLKIMEGQVKDLICLEQGCKTPADTDGGDLIKNLVDKPTFQRYCEMMSENYVDGSHMIVRCPRKECSAPMELIPNAPTDVQCLTCGQQFCTACKAPSHRGSPCLTADQKKDIRNQWNTADEKEREALKKRFGADNVRTALEDAESEEWISKNAKQCPKCKTPIEKINGCNKMACTSKGCGTYFCWLCNAELPHENPYSHFNAMSGSVCGGRLYQQYAADGTPLPLNVEPALLPGGIYYNQPRYAGRPAVQPFRAIMEQIRNDPFNQHVRLGHMFGGVQPAPHGLFQAGAFARAVIRRPPTPPRHHQFAHQVAALRQNLEVLRHGFGGHVPRRQR